MKHTFTDYIYIFGSVILTVYGQLILKWRVNKHGDLPELLTEKLIFLIRIVVDPYVISAFGAGFIAALCWMAAMTKFQLSFAYPFMSLAFVLVFALSILLFHESMTIQKVTGLSLIIIGIIVTSGSV